MIRIITKKIYYGIKVLFLNRKVLNEWKSITGLKSFDIKRSLMQVYCNQKDAMNIKKYRDEHEPDLISRSFWGFKHYYLDSKTRISFGLHISKMGKSYLLQRKNGLLWEETAWAYDVPFYKPDLQGLIYYLYWSENYNKRQKGKCCF